MCYMCAYIIHFIYTCILHVCIYNTHTHTYREKGREIYYKELAHVMREADKSSRSAFGKLKVRESQWHSSSSSPKA